MIELWNRLTAFLAKHHSRIGRGLLWLLVLFPALKCAMLMRACCVNQRFLDDWVWGLDLAKIKRGEFTFHDLCAVHLEHKPAFAKALALAVTLLAGGDIRSQCFLTYFCYLGSFLCLARLWLKRGGLTINEAWLPLLVAGMTLFNPVQWQNMLWPLCCETVMPTFFLLAAFCLAWSKRPWWARCLIAVSFSMAGMLSFASGVLLFALPLPVLLWCGTSLGNRQRWLFTSLWSVAVVVFMVFYFGVHFEDGTLKTNFVNEAPAQFSNHQGKDDTMKLELPFFLANPAQDLEFVEAFCGAFFARGWAADTKLTAIDLGFWLLLALLAATLYGLIHWRDGELRSRLLPMLCLALYTPLTGTMVAVGRVYHGGTGVALNMRYTAHQTQLIIGLVGIGLFIALHLSSRFSQPVRRLAGSLALGACGFLVGVLCVGWIYGASMMEEWQYARFKDAAAQRLCLLFPEYNPYMSRFAGGHEFGRQAVADLDDYHMLKPGPLKDRKLSSAGWQTSPRVLNDYHGLFQRLYKKPDGGWSVQGFANLPASFRTPDAVLLTYRQADGEQIIFGFTEATGVPSFLPRAMGKDLWAIRRGVPWPAETTCMWEEEIAMIEPPPPGSLVTAWAVDVQKNVIYKIRRQVKPDRKSKAPAEEPNGYTIESLATFVADAE